MTPAAEPPPVAVEFSDLFDGLGTAELTYRPAAVALDGRRVTIAGFVVPVHGRSDRFLLVDVPGACPDCSPTPVPALALVEPVAATAGGVAVRVEGRLGVGYAVDADGEATFLRLGDVRVL